MFRHCLGGDKSTPLTTTFHSSREDLIACSIGIDRFTLYSKYFCQGSRDRFCVIFFFAVIAVISAHHCVVDRDIMSARPSGKANDAPLSIEQRLELLEPRFTTPANGFGSPPGRAEPAAFKGVEADPSAHQDSPSSSKLSNNSNNATHSQHSFSFPTPMSRDRSTADCNLSTASNLPASSVRSRRRPSLNSSFHAVSMAASKHLRKVASSSTVQQQQSSPSNGSVGGYNSMPSSLFVMNDANRSMSGLPSSSNSRASSRSASNQTLLTSHVNRHRQPQPQDLQQRVVAESPPVYVTPHQKASTPKQEEEKPTAARNLQMTPNANAPVTSSVSGMNVWMLKIIIFLYIPTNCFCT